MALGLGSRYSLQEAQGNHNLLNIGVTVKQLGYGYEAYGYLPQKSRLGRCVTSNERQKPMKGP